MDVVRFDALTRTLGTGASRRRVLGGVLAALGLGALAPAGGVAKKKNRKKAKPNAFGCLNVGQKCRGKDAKCCSGICQGKKPKKGKRDTSTCAPHNTGICRQDSCSVGQNVPCNPANERCLCVVTTGEANFCANFTVPAEQLCRVCSKDRDCEVAFGPGAACIVLGGLCAGFCPATGGTACALPCA